MRQVARTLPRPIHTNRFVQRRMSDAPATPPPAEAAAQTPTPAAAPTPPAPVVKPPKVPKMPMFGVPRLPAAELLTRTQNMKAPLIVPEMATKLRPGMTNWNGALPIGKGFKLYFHPGKKGEVDHLSMWFKQQGSGVAAECVCVMPIEVDGEARQVTVVKHAAPFRAIYDGFITWGVDKHKGFGDLLISALTGKPVAVEAAPEKPAAKKKVSGPKLPDVATTYKAVTPFELPAALAAVKPNLVNGNGKLALGKGAVTYRHVETAAKGETTGPDQISVWVHVAPKGKVKSPDEFLAVMTLDGTKVVSVAANYGLDTVAEKLTTAGADKDVKAGKPLIDALTAMHGAVTQAQEAAAKKAAAKAVAMDKAKPVLERAAAGDELAAIYAAEGRAEDAAGVIARMKTAMEKRLAVLAERLPKAETTPNDRKRYAIEHHQILVKLDRADEAKAFLEGRLEALNTALATEGDKGIAALEARILAAQELEYSLKALGGDHAAKLGEVTKQREALAKELQAARKPAVKKGGKGDSKDPADSDAPLAME